MRAPSARRCARWGTGKISARPRHHAQNEYVVEDFKKTSRPSWQRSKLVSAGVEIELWWQDEARIGQKNKITHAGGPSVAHARLQSQRPAHQVGLHIRGHLPGQGQRRGPGDAPRDPPARNLHLAEISANVDPGAHAVILMDQAGWHTTPKLIVPDNITPWNYCPAPRAEPCRKRMAVHQGQLLSNRVFRSYEDIRALCCEAWNKLIERPWAIRSIRMRD